MLLAAFVWDAGAAVWPYNASDGTPVETDRLSESNWLAFADSIWLHHSYSMSIDCSPPRACYAKSQLVNYHFNCGRGFVYVRERISMDLNGDVVNHQVFEQPVPSYPLDEGARDARCRLCGCPDPDDLPRRRE